MLRLKGRVHNIDAAAHLVQCHVYGQDAAGNPRMFGGVIGQDGNLCDMDKMSEGYGNNFPFLSAGVRVAFDIELPEFSRVERVEIGGAVAIYFIIDYQIVSTDNAKKSAACTSCKTDHPYDVSCSQARAQREGVIK